MHLIRSATAPETSSRQDAFWHVGVALAKLRRAIADPKYSTDDYLVGSVLFLALLACTYGDIAGFELYKKNLAHLIKQLGGFDGLGYHGLLKACVLQWESFWEVDGAQTIFRQDRLMKSPTYPEPPVPPSIRKKISTLPWGFEHLASSCMLPLDLIEILSRVNEYHRPKKRLQLSKQLDPAWHQQKHADFWEACSSLAIPGPRHQQIPLSNLAPVHGQ